MAEIDFTPNNRFNVVENGGKSEKSDRRVVNQVGNGKKKKKGMLKRLSSNLEEMEKVSLKEKIIDDALIPGVKELIGDLVAGLFGTVADTVEDTVDIALWGEKRGRKGKKKKKNGTKVSYSDYYEDKNERKRGGNHGRRKIDVDEIWFDTRQEADEALKELIEMIEDYDCATVADLYSTAGEEHDFTDEKYGWDDLSAAYVSRGREGFMINLPKPKVLG